jgi:hypothetical protein
MGAGSEGIGREAQLIAVAAALIFALFVMTSIAGAAR